MIDNDDDDDGNVTDVDDSNDGERYCMVLLFDKNILSYSDYIALSFNNHYYYY